MIVKTSIAVDDWPSGAESGERNRATCATLFTTVIPMRRCKPNASRTVKLKLRSFTRRAATNEEPDPSGNPPTSPEAWDRRSHAFWRRTAENEHEWRFNFPTVR